MDLEELAEIVSEKLWLLKLEQLKKVGAEVKIPTGSALTNWALVKQITDFIDDVIENEDVAMYHLKTMLKKLNKQLSQKTFS